jgi:hypothetical protein
VTDTVSVGYTHTDGTYTERTITAERIVVQTWDGGRALLTLYAAGQPFRWVHLRCADVIDRTREAAP